MSSIISHRDIDSYTGISIVPGEIVLSETTTTAAWVNKTASGYEIMKDGKSISMPYTQISELGISRSGYDTLALAYTQSGGNLCFFQLLSKNTIHGFLPGGGNSNW